MKNLTIPLIALACISFLAACSSERRTQTTTHEQTIETVPADTHVIEKRTSTRIETEDDDD